MKKILIILALFAASGTFSAQAQYRQQNETVYGSNDGSVYRDDRGEYRWEMRERRVWIPERRTGGIFGVGRRTIPGHYEMRNERVKVYLNGKNGKKKGHPHGMPPGQRKKANKRDGDKYERRDTRYENGRDNRYETRRNRDNDRD